MARSACTRLIISIVSTLSLGGALAGCGAEPGDPPSPIAPYVKTQAATVSPASSCALLDNPDARFAMSGGLETALLKACGRSAELGQVRTRARIRPAAAVAAAPADVPVSNPFQDEGFNPPLKTRTQSETSMAINANTGTICSAFNDSHFNDQNRDINDIPFLTDGAGFSRSTDNGASFQDRGSPTLGFDGSHQLGARSDPSLVWRRQDGKFYLADLLADANFGSELGIGIWVSNDDCFSFTFLGKVEDIGLLDKEMMTVDNNPSSAHFGRFYLTYALFASGQPTKIKAVFSDDGLTWTPASAPLRASGIPQGSWPTVTPDGTVVVAWGNFRSTTSTLFDIELTRSTDGGANYGDITTALSGAIDAFDDGASLDCKLPNGQKRFALAGNWRILSFPQIASDGAGCLHMVYTVGPSTDHFGDCADVFYKKSCDGVNWPAGNGTKLNDDNTATDQFMPSLSIGPSGTLSVGWYDRRQDPTNNDFAFFNRISTDGGATFLPSQQISSVTSPVRIDPFVAPCYHGDYDQQVQTASTAYIQWADDRRLETENNENDADVYFSKIPTGAAVTVNPTNDAYVRDGSNANNNFGSDPTLQVKKQVTGNNRRAFLRFPIDTFPANFTTAKLRLFGNHTTGTTSDSAFAVASNSWLESTITWNNQPALGAKQGTSVTITTTAQYYEWDVTAFVKQQRAGGHTKASFAVTMDGTTTNSPDTFNSEESGTNKPELVAQ